ncbi:MULTISPECIES: hypothetical protein [unclassified Lysobacter]|uniref:hypothetical protein n=1 Tax=unclassified Lysobacter TaxID=2635362 RepID=UPI0006F61B5A|nr:MULTISPECIES: hypothetical protein [unclassified Lysobacter]KRA20084.1 hypothetical protein ASD69_01625 [Lysobacter sp. Root604]KRD39096.1 hypothetical protein ASE35_01605 [Lysobacter sp. Root916]
MRQVFSSARLENVESVAQMLRDADIEVRVTNNRSYKGNRRSGFSYSDNDSPKPAVWVVKSEDQVRAREILRAAGLIDSTRGGEGYSAISFRAPEQIAPARNPAQQRAFRIKLALIGGIVLVLVLAIVHSLREDPAESALAQHPLDGSVAAIPQPLAAAVFVKELSKAAPIDTLCLSIDGKDVSKAMIDAMQAQLRGRRVAPLSECVRIPDEEQGSVHRASGHPALLVDVKAFRPQTRESGKIEYEAYHHRMSASYKTLEVKSVDGQWQVVRTLKHVAM